MLAEKYPISAVTAFRTFQDFMRAILKAVPRSPAIKLRDSSPAENHQFLPELLHKVKNSGDGLFLLLIPISQGISVHMDMETCSRCLM